MKSRLTNHVSPEAFQQSYIRTEYSPYTRNQVQRILRTGIDDQAISREEVEAITIDGINSLDLDDAIWVERARDGGYCVWIHISDVSEAIPLYSPLDLEALHRTTSIYRKDHILDMIPPELSNGPLSLDIYGGKKLTYSLQIDIDNQGQIGNTRLFESRFTNLRRYDYESFGEDFSNPDSEHFQTLQLLKEVSDKLRARRLLSGGILHFNDDNRRLSIGDKTPGMYHPSQGASISHDIIESLMVLGNTTVGNVVASDASLPQLFKRHDSVGEASFYYHKPAFHHGLQVSNYTHFTSPIRRYVDIVIHRILKALQRGEDIPYREEDMKFIAEHSNNTRWKVENLGRQIDIDTRGQLYYQKQEARLGRALEVYDMKPYIRNTTESSLKLPKVMRDAIKEKIQTGKLGNWIWSAGVILVGQERELKELIRKCILEDQVMRYQKFLSILEQTRILRGQDALFSFEYHDGDTSSISVIFRGQKIIEVSSGRDDTIPPIQRSHKLRREVIERIFDYFLSL
ncbi:ribonuclease catalytic domain-containing protein [Candidatus Gracilibacteria bacterium]|nr:ribonuclease catalytic domain-containing protein [Candidatus Gracilibacteria bacterium]